MSDELSPSEVARRLGTSTRSVQRWIARGELPARRVGGRWRVASDAFDALAPAQASTSPPKPSGIHAPPSRVIRTLFIANRGEIAARIARTCRSLGIESVIPPTDGPAAIDLLDGPSVVAAAGAAGADAVHPGFGFLAEQADFAEGVLAAGIAWVGPPPAAIRAMGDKAAARHLAAGLGIPTPPGYDGTDQSEAALAFAADGIGFPVLVKPSAGGGGKGMRIVHDAGRLGAEVAAARREAAAAFGNDRLILERLIEGARHVEIQVLFDGHGRGVHLGERDCSLQRRHQKILEEAPSPAVGPGLRKRMGEAAVRLATAVGYVSAGTCEFLLEADGSFTFLEMNTRLQVEHPVTELVTGRDLVADQLRIAAGAPLTLDQAGLRHEGHAIEVRLYAEDADAGFLPATGRVERLRWPSGPGIRVDAGIAEGDEVTGRFDPMLAKIIAHGRDRDEALGRLRRALDETVVLGLTTNLRFLRWLLRQPVVAGGEARTDTLERIWPPEDADDVVRIPEPAWGAAAHALARLAHAAGDSWGGGWRLNAPAAIRVEAGGEIRTVTVEASPPPAVGLVRAQDVVHVDVDGRSVAFRVAPPPDVDRAAHAAAAAHHGGPVELVAPMPGRVRAIDAVPGTAVDAGDAVVTLEAMKMEHAVVAPIAGRVTELTVQLEEQVERGQRLAIVEP